MDGIDEDSEARKVNAQTGHIHMVIVIPLRALVTSVIKYMKSLRGKNLRKGLIS